MPFNSLFCLIALIKTSNIMLNKSSEGGRSGLVLELEESVFTVHILSMMLAEGLLYAAFIMLRWLSGKNTPAKKRDADMQFWFICELGRSLGGRDGNPLQYSCLENPMGRRAW